MRLVLAFSKLPFKAWCLGWVCESGFLWRDADLVARSKLFCNSVTPLSFTLTGVSEYKNTNKIRELALFPAPWHWFWVNHNLFVFCVLLETVFGYLSACSSSFALIYPFFLLLHCNGKLFQRRRFERASSAPLSVAGFHTMRSALRHCCIRNNILTTVSVWNCSPDFFWQAQRTEFGDNRRNLSSSFLRFVLSAAWNIF